MGSAGSRGSSGRASSGPAAASCGISLRSAPWGGPPGARPATGDPRSPLESPVPAPRRRGQPRVYSRSHTRWPPALPPPHGERGCPAGAAPAPLLSLSRVGRGPVGGPVPLPRLLPRGREHCPPESGSTTEAPRARRTARSLPSGDGAAHKGRLSIVLLPDPQIPSSPPGEANGKGRHEGRRRGEAKCPRRRPPPGVSRLPSSPFPKLAFVPCLPSKPACPPSLVPSWQRNGPFTCHLA